jgi:hypothetical protein
LFGQVGSTTGKARRIRGGVWCDSVGGWQCIRGGAWFEDAAELCDDVVGYMNADQRGENGPNERWWWVGSVREVDNGKDGRWGWGGPAKSGGWCIL